MNKSIFIVFIMLVVVSCQPSKKQQTIEFNNIDIQKISDNAFVHISYLIIPNYGKFGCNGLVYVNNGEAIIFDTPVDKVASKQLINWVEKELKATIKGIVVNHFHVDCLGGLEYFHSRNIPSYALKRTFELAKADSVALPMNTFEEKIVIPVGNTTVESVFLGEGHTRDNTVGWIADEKILFGGCMVKSLGASKGNIRDANIKEWANTVQKVKDKYANVETVIPGHGKIGDVSLLDYTIELFTK